MKIASTLSKQTILLLIGFLSLSTLFLPLTTLQAATISNGMDAAYVLGEETFESRVLLGGPGDILFAGGSVYDSDDERFFAIDILGPGAGRILVWDLSSGITNGMDASYVIGQEDYVSNATATDQDSFAGWPYDIAYDPEDDYLFVSDYAVSRVLVFDLSGGITNGMSASYVLGPSDFTTEDRIGVPGTSTTPYPTGLAYDESNDRLFVASGNIHRVTVFDLSGGITNGMNASYVLGQEDFTSSGGNLDQDGMLSPQMIEYDQLNDRLFVPNDLQSRILVYDVAPGNIANGMDASYVIGQENFTSNATTVDVDGVLFPTDSTYDSNNDRLFVADNAASRVTVYDLANIENGMDASYVLGQEDFNSSATATDQDSFWTVTSVEYDATNNWLFAGDQQGSRFLVFDLSTPAASSSGWSFIHPPTCNAQFSPSTITQGENTTLSWNITWPTNKQGTHYTRVPGKDGGLFSSNVSSIQMSPQHSQSITMYTFNLWGANPCTAEVEVLGANGEEVVSENNAYLTAGASNSPVVKVIINFFKNLF